MCLNLGAVQYCTCTVYERAPAFILFSLVLFNPGLCLAGIMLVLAVKPGVGYAVKEGEVEDEESFSTAIVLLDLVR